MRNQAMQRKLENGDAIDVSGFKRTDDWDYILPDFVPDIDYCDRKAEAWIWSIGQHKRTGQILASLSAKFYQNPDFECLWLR